MFCRGSDVLAIQECSSCRVIFTMARFALTLAVVLVAVFLQETQALSFERQPEDDLLDQWLQEQMAEVQSSPDTPVLPGGFAGYEDGFGFATPGHAEEQDYMTAFFENQDHEAFADTAEDRGYIADSQMDRYLADFFGTSEDSQSEMQEEVQPDPSTHEDYYTPWTDEAPSVNQAQPDMEGYVKNYFSNLRQQKPPSTGNSRVEASSRGGKYTYAKIEDSQVNGYMGDGVAGDDGYFDFFGNQRDSSQGATMSQSLPEDDLELWFQAMNQESEETEEEEEDETDTSKLNVNFMDEFPDELLTQAELQAVVQMAPECSPWKDKIERGQKAMKEHGCILQKIVREEKAAIDAYNAKKKISCERDCKIICVPTIVGKECTEKVNGTCVTEVPKVEDCGIRYRDPECEAEEAGCMAELRPLAEEMERTMKEANAERIKMDIEARKLEVELDDIPSQCVLPQGYTTTTKRTTPTSTSPICPPTGD